MSRLIQQISEALAAFPASDSPPALIGGLAPNATNVASIHAEMLIVLAADDERVNGTWPAYKAAMDAAHVKYTLFQPADTTHGFNNDTTPRYNEGAAKEAWKRTLALFERRLTHA